jgi:hypothetical protein
VERAGALSKENKQAAIDMYSNLLRLMQDLGLEAWEKGKLSVNTAVPRPVLKGSR